MKGTEKGQKNSEAWTTSWTSAPPCEHITHEHRIRWCMRRLCMPFCGYIRLSIGGLAIPLAVGRGWKHNLSKTPFARNVLWKTLCNMQSWQYKKRTPLGVGGAISFAGDVFTDLLTVSFCQWDNCLAKSHPLLWTSFFVVLQVILVVFQNASSH